VVTTRLICRKVALIFRNEQGHGMRSHKRSDLSSACSPLKCVPDQFLDVCILAEFRARAADGFIGGSGVESEDFKRLDGFGND